MTDENWSDRRPGELQQSHTEYVLGGNDTEIGPQMASKMIKMKPQEVFELVEEELVRKSK